VDHQRFERPERVVEQQHRPTARGRVRGQRRGESELADRQQHLESHHRSVTEDNGTR
jgi:hypothetical protein